MTDTAPTTAAPAASTAPTNATDPSTAPNNAGPSPDAPVTEPITKPVAPARDRASDAVARALRAERELKVARDEVSREKARADKEAARAAEVDSTIKRWKEDPYGVGTKELGVSYEEMTQRILKGEPAAPARKADVHLTELEKKFADQQAVIESLQSTAKERADAEAAQQQLRIEQAATQRIADFAKSDDRFPLVSGLGATANVIQEIEAYYAENPDTDPQQMLEACTLRAEQKITATITQQLQAILQVPRGMEMVRALLNPTAPVSEDASPKPSQQAPAKPRAANSSLSAVSNSAVSAASRQQSANDSTRRLPWNVNVHKERSASISQAVSDAKHGRV